MAKRDRVLYRDDGLIIVNNMTGHNLNRLRKAIIQTFKYISFEIVIRIQLVDVDFKQFAEKQKKNSLEAKTVLNSYAISIFFILALNSGQTLHESG